MMAHKPSNKDSQQTLIEQMRVAGGGRIALHFHHRPAASSAPPALNSLSQALLNDGPLSNCLLRLLHVSIRCDEILSSPYLIVPPPLQSRPAPVPFASFSFVSALSNLTILLCQSILNTPPLSLNPLLPTLLTHTHARARARAHTHIAALPKLALEPSLTL